MPIEMEIWRIEGKKVQPLSLGGMDLESDLEDVIENEPSTIDPNLLVIGRQIRVDGGPIDLLAIDADAKLVVIELKRKKTPRDVVAQALDYGSSVRGKTKEQIKEIFTQYQRSRGVGHPEELAEAFQRQFGGKLDSLNSSHRLLIVAAEVDSGTERIVRYLQDEYGADNIDVVSFRAFQDGDHWYLARSWMSEQETSSSSNAGREWNGECYVNFDEGDKRSWSDARKYGFVSAGDDPFVRDLNRLQTEDRVWVYVPRKGYVGVGTVTAPAVHYDEFKVNVKGIPTPIVEVGLETPGAFDEKYGQHFVAVEWMETVALEEAVREQDFFSNPHVVARPRSPRWKYTVERLKSLWGVK